MGNLANMYTISRIEKDEDKLWKKSILVRKAFYWGRGSAVGDGEVCRFVL